MTKIMDKDDVIIKLYWALDLAKNHFIVNDLSLPRVFEEIDEAMELAEIYWGRKSFKEDVREEDDTNN